MLGVFMAAARRWPMGFGDRMRARVPIFLLLLPIAGVATRSSPPQRSQETNKPSSNLTDQRRARRAEEGNSRRTNHAELPVGPTQLQRFCMLPTWVERLHPPVVMVVESIQLHQEI